MHTLTACDTGPLSLTELPVIVQEVLLLYRRKSSPGWLRKLRDKVFGEEEGPRLMRREPIMLRVLRDIPVPSWKLVLPDKLLQFRPLDGLRADLVTVAGRISIRFGVVMEKTYRLDRSLIAVLSHHGGCSICVSRNSPPDWTRSSHDLPR